MENKFTIEDSIKILNGMNISISAQNLVYYSYKGDVSVVKHLINSGVDVNSINNEGFYAIIQAALNNHKEIVELLISEGANINKVGSDKYDALTVAAYKGHVDIVDILINNGAAIDGNVGVLAPPIGAAIVGNHVEIIKLLANAGADLNYISEDGYSLAYTCFHECPESTYNLLVSLGAHPISEDLKKKPSFFEKIWAGLKMVYAKNAYTFIAVNIFCFSIIFFVLDTKTGGGIFSRIFTFLFCLGLGGFLGAVWSVKRNGGKLEWFRMGGGTFLMIVTLLLWSNNGYVRSVSSSSDTSSSGSYSGSHTCTQCGSSYSGNGWSTAGGEQFLYSSDPGYDACCSKSCAYESQPDSWK